jgi:hypothetical protein
MKKSGNDKTVAKNVAKALAEVPIDNKQERDALRARLRQKYDELERLRMGMKEDDRKRFDEIGELTSWTSARTAQLYHGTKRWESHGKTPPD